MAALPPGVSTQTGPTVPGATPVTVGGVTFTSLEAPDGISFSAGEAQVTVVKISGGSRNVKNFGAQPDPIAMAGTIWTPNVSSKTEQLLAMMVAGTEILTTWSTHRYYGYVSKFKPNFRNTNRCNFDITIEVTRDGNGAYTSTSPPSLDAQTSALMSNTITASMAVTSIDPTAVNTIPPAMLTNLSSSLTAGAPLSQNVGTPLGTQILAYATTAIAAVNTYLGGLPALSPALVPANQMLNNLMLIVRNVQQGQSPTTVTAMNTSPYELAVTNGGSIDDAFSIASANKLVSMRPPSSVLQTLTIPPLLGS